MYFGYISGYIKGFVGEDENGYFIKCLYKKKLPLPEARFELAHPNGH